MQGGRVEFENGMPSAVHSGEPGSFFLVILDSFNREAILVTFRMDPRYKPAGMTEKGMSCPTLSIGHPSGLLPFGWIPATNRHG
jgi:hypothetical protein